MNAFLLTFLAVSVGYNPDTLRLTVSYNIIDPRMVIDVYQITSRHNAENTFFIPRLNKFSYYLRLS
jgi:hypothetical protein